MKKILGILMFLVLLVSCSKDSGDGVTGNFIEINGDRLQSDIFETNDKYIGIGADKVGKPNEVLGAATIYTRTSLIYGKKVYFVDASNEIQQLGISYKDVNHRYMDTSYFNEDSYYYVKKVNDDTYEAEIYLKSYEYTVRARYVGKIQNVW